MEKTRVRADSMDVQEDSAAARWRGAFNLLLLGICIIIAGSTSVCRSQRLRGVHHSDPTNGRRIYNNGCIACHGSNGQGAEQKLTQFTRPDTFPDFSQCYQTTPEPNSNWKAVIVHGGPSRGFSQIMPAFGDLLSSREIDDVIAYLRHFCTNPHWARGELNLPRALVTEKAFPEDELVVSTAMNATGAPKFATDFIHEERFGVRNQIEVDLPLNNQDQNHSWQNGIGVLPEQMPYLEWLHSDYPKTNTCQSCHMPEVHEAVAVTAIFGQPREGMHRHEFIGGNFVVQRMLNEHRADLSVVAQPGELTTAADRTVDFLKSQSARVTIQNLESNVGGFSLDVLVQNLTGHKFPTAYPSRRAWLHVTVQDRNRRVIFESGALNPDGSIAGNANDADRQRYERHYREITSAQQVEIFESILMDSQKNVTTGLLSAVGYLKDNRILPSGFDKRTAGRDIAVVGDALDDPRFTDRGSLIRYVVNTGNAPGPFHIDAELWYQPIGFRWAHNLESYNAMEPRRFVGYYESEARRSAVMLTKAEVNH